MNQLDRARPVRTSKETVATAARWGSGGAGTPEPVPLGELVTALLSLAG